MRGEPLTIVRRVEGGTDSHGNVQMVDGDTVTIGGCSWAPAAGSDVTENGRDGAKVDATAYLPPGAVVGRRDVFVRGGHRYDVIGEPGVWRSKYRRREVGVVVSLSRSEG
ncbi:MAG: hypothetical protein WBJ65_07815 [Candidatus Microthrix parvicella]